MAKTNTNFRIHKNRKSKFRISKQYRRFRQSNSIYKKIILFVIFAAMFIVIIASINIIFINNEKLVKDRIDSIARDYYENYFYNNFSNSDKFKKLNNLDEAMEKYHNQGFASVSLNDLLLYDNHKNEQYADFLTKYCDRNKTRAKFYIDPPYEKTSYHVEYTYSCNF